MKTTQILAIIALTTACTEKSTFKGAANVVKNVAAAKENVDESDAKDEPKIEAKSEEVAITVAAKLNGARWELPCDREPGPDQKSCVNTPRTVNKVVKMEGDADKDYEVTLHIRGVVEPMLYKEGVQSAVDPHFYEGGVPNEPSFNIYRLSTSLPVKDYYLNLSPSISAITFVIDYKVTIVIRGQSNVTLFADNQNGDSISNFARNLVPGLDTSPALVSGQFVQMDVVSVKLKE